MTNLSDEGAVCLALGVVANRPVQVGAWRAAVVRRGRAGCGGGPYTVTVFAKCATLPMEGVQAPTATGTPPELTEPVFTAPRGD